MVNCSVALSISIVGYTMFFHRLRLKRCKISNEKDRVYIRPTDCLLISFVLTDIANTLKCRNKCVRIKAYNSRSVLFLSGLFSNRYSFEACLRAFLQLS